MTRLSKIIILLAPLLIVISSLAQVDKTALTVTGVIHDNKGNPSANATVGGFWLLGAEDSSGARNYSGVTSDDKGAFTLPTNDLKLPAMILVYSKDRREAATVLIAHPGTLDTVRLVPVDIVHLAATAGKLGTNLHGTRFLLESSADGTLGQLVSADVHMPLPPGRYKMLLSSADTLSRTSVLSVPSVRSTNAHFALTLSPMARRYGASPPSVTGLVDAKGNAFAMPKLDRPTLLYFWADWCQPCISEGIPHLLSFVQAHMNDKDRFQIIAIHENGIPDPTTEIAYSHSLTNLERKVWKQQLSFPFLFDSEGQTTKAWGLSTFPTYALVDADGNLQPDGSLEKLDALLKH